MRQRRREFIRTSLTAAGSLLVEFQFAVLSHAAPVSPAVRQHLLSGCLRITEDNRFYFRSFRAEIGQGAETALATILCEELDVSPEKLIIDQPQMSPDNHPDYQPSTVGGSSTVRRAWRSFREVGAMVREKLRQAAAKEYQVGLEDVSSDDGHLVIKKIDKIIPYGVLAAKAADLTVSLEKLTLKSSVEFKYVGQFDRRLDARKKVLGQTQYAIDITQPDQLVAVIVRCPVFEGRPETVDAAAVLARPGVRKVITMPYGVAILADSYWQADNARAYLDVVWDKGELANLSEKDIQKAFLDASENDGELVRESGAGAAVANTDQQVLKAVYSMPFLSQSPLEPMNCVARVSDGTCEAWVPTQAPEKAVRWAAQVAGVAEENVTIHITYQGGGFGRRLQHDYMVEAVYLARQVQSTVKLVWSREDDLTGGFYRPACWVALKVFVDKNDNIARWEHKLVGPGRLGAGLSAEMKADYGSLASKAKAYLSETKENLLPDKEVGPFRQGTRLPYKSVYHRVDYHYVNPGIPVGYWRSVGHSQNVFAIECGIDEVAFALGNDPLAYRLARMNESRMANVLEIAAKMAQWGKLPGCGLAAFHAYDSFIALVAKLERDSQFVRVTEFYCCADVGMVVNPDIVRQQIEGGLIYGLSAAVGEKITIKQGAVEQDNFDKYPLLNIEQTPLIHIDIVRSDQAPGGVGELAVPVVAPAVANAWFSASGKRVRHLPLNGPL